MPRHIGQKLVRTHTCPSGYVRHSIETDRLPLLSLDRDRLSFCETIPLNSGSALASQARVYAERSATLTLCRSAIDALVFAWAGLDQCEQRCGRRDGVERGGRSDAPSERRGFRQDRWILERAADV